MLTATEIKKAPVRDKTYKLHDYGGLYLSVLSSGGKSFRYDYRFAGKRKTLTLGRHPEMTLARARELHLEARRLLQEGQDPSLCKRQAKRVVARSLESTFEGVANEWFQTKMVDKSLSYRGRTRRILDNDLVPTLGRMPISELTPVDLLEVLRKIEIRTVDIAHRAKQTASQVFKYAIATGRATADPCRDLQGALRPRSIEHHAAITDPVEFGKLLLAMDTYRGSLIIRKALALSPILFQRPGEIRRMEWSEINFNEARWEIPAEKMKMSRSHIVPLPKQAIAHLLEIQSVTGNSAYVFPSARGRTRCLSDNGVRVALRSLGYDNRVMTPHGFRASARTMLDEVLGFRPDWIEHQLAHAVRDPNGRAYNRTAHLVGRTEMMQTWADYLDYLRSEAEIRFGVQ